MIIVSGIRQHHLNMLENIFAYPVEGESNIVWVIPAWLAAMRQRIEGNRHETNTITR